MTLPKNHIFIGYDEREKDPFNVCVQSLKDSSADPDRIVIHPIFHRDLRDRGFFDRPWTITPEGTYEDVRDGRPFSVQFSHSRFLTPYLAHTMGINDIVMFVDCDFVFKGDVNDLFTYARDQRYSYPVQVVKHDYNPTNSRKMDNAIQTNYNKKLWSALMMFDSDFVRNLTPEYVNRATGKQLHSFEWLGDDNLIGELPMEWHFVGNHSEKYGVEPKAIHYTEGGPWFEKYQDCPYALDWFKSYYKYIQQGVPR